MNTDTRPASERLRERFERMRAKGLMDLKVWAPHAKGADIEDLCAEMLEMLDIYDRGLFVDISEKLK